MSRRLSVLTKDNCGPQSIHHGFVYEVFMALTLFAVVLKLVINARSPLTRTASSGLFDSEGTCIIKSLSHYTRFFHPD